MKVQPSEEMVKFAIYRMKELGEEPEDVVDSMMESDEDLDQEDVEIAVYRATKQLGIKYENRWMNPETLTDRDLTMAMYYMKRFKRSPNYTKDEIKTRAFNPNSKYIDIAVDEAARRLGLGPDETLLDKEREQQ